MSGTGYQSFQNEEDPRPHDQHDGMNVQVAGSVPPVAFSGQSRPPPYQNQPHQNPAPVPQGGYGAQHAVYQQPAGGPVGGPQAQGKAQLMPMPQGVPGCPPGLEYLAHLDQLLVHQQIELAEVFLNVEFENKYVIKNSLGQQVYFANEESEFCERIWCGNNRGFLFHITDNMGQEVLRVVREFKCCAGCCWCADNNHCSLFVAVESPPGNVIGYVRQTQSKMSPHFDVLSADQDCILKIRGHWCRCQAICCTDDIDFKILTNNLETQVGKVSKQWGGWVRESFTKADNFGVQFPQDLDVKVKATLLASTFLIDFMYFEHRKKNKQY